MTDEIRTREVLDAIHASLTSARAAFASIDDPSGEAGAMIEGFSAGLKFAISEVELHDPDTKWKWASHA
ncbi:hypothetical protein [Brevibacterium album]|uniref:hypothetical protein n=1 Tax=Brevibacterium album TaxID=417948 RepID=UPI00041D661B|nr:hypothetical protein [Brevibacterium album]